LETLEEGIPVHLDFHISLRCWRRNSEKASS
jgi:hypothetical protein